MIRLRRGTVIEVVGERPGAVEVTVEVGGDAGGGEGGLGGGEGGSEGGRTLARAIAYPSLTGPIRPGDQVLLNTTAAWLGLGTGGMHFVISVEGTSGLEAEGAGRTMKLRYTPHQVPVLAAEEEGSPHRAALEQASTLGGTPVVWVPLHSMVGPAVAGAKAAGAARVAYAMTDGAALPSALSRLTAALRSSELLDSVVSCGQAFGGDLEAVNVFTGLLAGGIAAGADVIVVGDGPGNTGTNTIWGASDIESAMSLNAAAILGGRAVAALRISFADLRERHRGVSHHSVTALSRVALAPVHVAVPSVRDDEVRQAIWSALRDGGLEEKHQLVEVTGQPALDLLADRGIQPESMGRGVAEDPVFFLAAGAAGVLAGRMAAGGQSSRGEGTPENKQLEL